MTKMHWIKSHKNLLLVCVLISALTGCNKGCTTQSTIDAESKTVTICGEEATVTVRFIESKHSRRVAGGALFDRTVTYNYGLAFDLETKYWSKEEILYEPWPAEEDPDLNLMIERFKVRSAKSNLHFAFGMDEELYGVYHVIGTHAFSSNLSPLGLQPDSKLNAINFLRMESPESILYKAVSDGKVCMVDPDDQENIQAIFDQLEPSSRIPLLALAEWPDCYLVEQYYSDEKVLELAQDPTWKQAAIDRCLGVLQSDKESFLNSDEAMELLAILNDNRAYDALDTFYAGRFGDNKYSEANDYIFERIVNQERPMQLDVKEALMLRVDEAVQNFYDTGDDKRELKIHRCIRLYLLLGQEEKADQFLAYCYADNHLSDSYFELEAGTFDNFDLYSAAQQELILAQSLAKIPDLKDYLRTSVYDELSEHAPCDVLAKLLSDYPEDLEYSELPERCGAQ